MEPSDEVRELRRLRDAVGSEARETDTVSRLVLAIFAMSLVAWGVFRGVDALDRIAACQCHATATEAE